MLKTFLTADCALQLDCGWIQTSDWPTFHCHWGHITTCSFEMLLTAFHITFSIFVWMEEYMKMKTKNKTKKF